MKIKFIKKTIFLLVLCHLGLYANLSLASQQYYKVRWGDTLWDIARKHNTSVKKLRQLNNLKKDSVLVAGKVLVVKKSTKKSTKKKQAMRWVGVGVETKVKVPNDYQLAKAQQIKQKVGDFEFLLYAQQFAQGNAAYLEIHKRPIPGEQIEASFAGGKLLMQQKDFGYNAIFAIGPKLKPGKQPLEVVFSQLGQKRNFSFDIAIQKTSYPVFKRSKFLGNYDLPQKQASPEQKRIWEENNRKKWQRIEREKKRKSQLFARRSPNMLGNRFSHPRDSHSVTSEFYTLRKTTPYYIKNRKKQYKESYSYHHRGLDLRGWYHAPIYALAPGEVVCAENMYYEGNFVIIDHGNDIFSYYMHQSSISVKPGQRVAAGHLIGKSGNSGQSRGPHLHISLRIQGHQVNPLSLLSLPIR